MKKTIKAMSILLIVAIFTMIFATNVMAATATEIIDTMGEQKIEDTANLTTVGGKIIDVITTVGIVVSVIVLLVIGIKYMMGSASEKAEYKKTMIPYLVGAVLVFGAAAIAKAIVSMASNITA